MFKSLYRLLFARRATWTLTHDSEDGKIRFTIYDATPADVEAGWDAARYWMDQGWTLVSAPKQDGHHE